METVKTEDQVMAEIDTQWVNLQQELDWQKALNEFKIKLDKLQAFYDSQAVR